MAKLIEEGMFDKIQKAVYEYSSRGKIPIGVVLSMKVYDGLIEELAKANSQNLPYLFNNETLLGLRVSVLTRDWITETIIVTN